ncbi:MAG TPA: DNA helicase UvrD, partial [Spirochaetales bacterium]|nr:DNA helicase UvrD [Spirochaetales bacterium]
SGFDSIRECYRDLSDHIFAVETGLSSDPPMNWLCSFLDQYTLISNSDAHSPEKLGREANIFAADLSYEGIIRAIKEGSSAGFGGTIEFFPQEGKYHYDGHRKCAVSWDPLQTLKHNELCPVCGKKVTIGVMNRVAQLADRDALPERKTRPPFFSLVPLKEILAEISGVGDEGIFIEEAAEPVHWRIAGETGLYGKYVVRKISITFSD